MRLVALAAFALLAGCASPDGLRSAGGEAAIDPYYKEHRELLAGEHHKVFEVPVEPGALLLDVVGTLEARTNGLPVPAATPATLRITLLAPDGVELAVAELDARHGREALTIAWPDPGIHLVRVDGFGVSQPVEGEAYGSAYTLVTEIVY